MNTKYIKFNIAGLALAYFVTYSVLCSLIFLCKCIFKLFLNKKK